MPYAAHCKFSHDIDSRGSGASDEGDMFLLPNGDCIEMGIMLNPETGKEELYKEYWTAAPSTGVHRPGYIVAEWVEESGYLRGIAIRVADYLQVIKRPLKDDGPVQVLRSSLQKGGHAHEPRWEVDSRCRSLGVDKWLVGPDLEVGDVFKVRDELSGSEDEEIWMVTEKGT